MPFVDTNYSDFDHGTHVVGIAVGKRNEEGNGMGDGVASEAKVAFFDISSEADDFFHPPDNEQDIEKMFRFARVANAKIHSASWGSFFLGSVYTIKDYFYDKYLYENQDMAMFVAAGNEGFQTIQNTVRYHVNHTIASPGTGKNVITGKRHDDNFLFLFHVTCKFSQKFFSWSI